VPKFNASSATLYSLEPSFINSVVVNLLSVGSPTGNLDGIVDLAEKVRIEGKVDGVLRNLKDPLNRELAAFTQSMVEDWSPASGFNDEITVKM